VDDAHRSTSPTASGVGTLGNVIAMIGFIGVFPLLAIVA
jgi:hypothetical protein